MFDLKFYSQIMLAYNNAIGEVYIDQKLSRHQRTMMTRNRVPYKDDIIGIKCDDEVNPIDYLCEYLMDYLIYFEMMDVYYKKEQKLTTRTVYTSR